MNKLAEKVRGVERDIESEKGPVNLFAFFERADVYDRWDVVVAAPWARHDAETLRYLADVIKRHLTPQEMVRLSRIVILDADEDPVKSLTEAYQVEHGQVRLTDPEDFDLPVRRGYIFTARRAA